MRRPTQSAAAFLEAIERMNINELKNNHAWVEVSVRIDPWIVGAGIAAAKECGRKAGLEAKLYPGSCLDRVKSDFKAGKMVLVMSQDNFIRTTVKPGFTEPMLVEKEWEVRSAIKPKPNKDLLVKYNELIMAVAQKFPGETRHETALRYILEREGGVCCRSEACEAKI